jgi:hypothetical protein
MSEGVQKVGNQVVISPDASVVTGNAFISDTTASLRCGLEATDRLIQRSDIQDLDLLPRIILIGLHVITQQSLR